MSSYLSKHWGNKSGSMHRIISAFRYVILTIRTRSTAGALYQTIRIWSACFARIHRRRSFWVGAATLFSLWSLSVRLMRITASPEKGRGFPRSFMRWKIKPMSWPFRVLLQDFRQRFLTGLGMVRCIGRLIRMLRTRIIICPTAACSIYRPKEAARFGAATAPIPTLRAARCGFSSRKKLRGRRVCYRKPALNIFL